MTHKYLTILFFEESDSISAESTTQILSLSLAYAFLLLNFLITGLCNSSASCSFTLIPDPFSYQKNHRLYLLMVFDIHHSYNF